MDGGGFQLDARNKWPYSEKIILCRHHTAISHSTPYRFPGSGVLLPIMYVPTNRRSAK
ncbi:hypothetical protein DESC_730085 [Desulfosarcina cetonica]|nr:hypothetical protein DESC_730085 [Desulfosarcina cetonica]